ncbi:putative TLC domain-containing protein [Helianthus annuus]|nr:putative TLC domain-containing protein [Helianthus annuus]
MRGTNPIDVFLHEEACLLILWLSIEDEEVCLSLKSCVPVSCFLLPPNLKSHEQRMCRSKHVGCEGDYDFTYLCYVTMSAKNPILIKAVGMGLQLVSAFWFYKIAKVVKYKLITKSTFKTC